MDKLEMMRTFLCVSQEGAFSKAAEKLDTSPQLVSKYVAALEQRLNTRLFYRTTRKVTLTQAGQQYALRCSQILDDIEETENQLADWHQRVSGQLTINAPMSFGHRHLPALLSDFQRRYPEVDIKLNLTDHKVDIVKEGVDIALRIGSLKSDSVIAKRIASIRLAILASPDYLERKGTPNNTAELGGHDFLNYSYSEQNQLQHFLDLDPREAKIRSPITANNGDLLVSLASLGQGIIIQPTFIAGNAIKAGRLVEIMPEHALPDLGLFLVYANRQFMPSRVRAFIDFASHYYPDNPKWYN